MRVLGLGGMGPWDHGPRPGPGPGRIFLIFSNALGGPYLASPGNLPLGELIGTSFGAVRGPIRPFLILKIGPTYGQAGQARQDRLPVNQALVAVWPDRNTLGFQPRWPPAVFSQKNSNPQNLDMPAWSNVVIC